MGGLSSQFTSLSRTSTRRFVGVAHLVLLLVVAASKTVGTNGDDSLLCTLCPGGEGVPLPNKQLNLTWPVQVSNCSMLQVYADSLLPAETTECANVQSVSTLCGCAAAPDACQLCPDGSNVTVPYRKLSFTASHFDGTALSCQELDAYLHSINNDTIKCQEAQSTAPACDCPVLTQNPCKMCSKEMPTSSRSKALPQFPQNFVEWQFDPTTCEMLAAIVYSTDQEGTITCSSNQHLSSLCSCGDDISDPVHRRQVILAWLPRISAVLSICGSSFIIYDILKNKRHHETTQHFLLLTMSSVDILSSTAWLLSTIPIPETYPNGDPTYVYGARGNKATCKTQGFFIQLGLAVPFCNLCLAVYYMLVIIYDWREARIKKYRIWLIGTPLFIGVVLAFAGIPFYWINPAMCYVVDNKWESTLFFITIPISVVVFFATLITIMIYLKVYHQDRRVRRWIVGSNVQSLPRKVFWQGFWYLMCFYVSWPLILVLVNIPGGGLYSLFGLTCAVIFVTPLQGFLNCLAYTRQRCLRFMKQHKVCPCSWRAQVCCSLPASTDRQHELGSSDKKKETVTTGPVIAPCTGEVNGHTHVLEPCCPLSAEKGNDQV